jgi:hypothetical protein
MSALSLINVQLLKKKLLVKVVLRHGHCAVGGFVFPHVLGTGVGGSLLTFGR